MALEIASAAVTLPQFIVEFLPDLGRKLVQWKETLNQNPNDINNLISEISVFNRSLDLYEHHFSANGHADHLHTVLHTRFNHFAEQFQQLQIRCAALLEISTWHRYKIYPSILSQKVADAKRQLEASHDALQNLIALLPTSATATSTSRSSRYVVVRNVESNPPGVFLNFESVDSKNTPLTLEGKLKAAIFDHDLSSHNGAAGVVAARGMGGVGKTCAIRAIGLLPETERRFPGGTLFMTIGVENGLSHLIDALAATVALAGGSEEAETIREEKSLSVAIQLVRKWFQHHVCLFIIDDIWCVRGISPHTINQLSNIAKHRRSRVVYTTRDGYLKCGKHVFFRERLKDGNESKRILLQCAGNISEPTDALPRHAFTTILDQCNGLPLSLAIAGSAVREIVERGTVACEHDAWQEYLDRNRFKNVVAQTKNYCGRDISASIVLSLDLMDESREIKSRSMRWLFKAMCVFRKQQAVPLSVVARLWDMDESDVEMAVDRMERFSLVQRSTIVVGGNRTRHVSLHDLVLDVARELSHGECDSYFWVKKLVQTYLPTTNSDCPRGNAVSNLIGTKPLFGHKLLSISGDGFILESLCWLLYCAKMCNDLLWATCDPRWIANQMCNLGDRQVAGDIGYSIQSLREGAASLNDEQRDKMLLCLNGLKQVVRLSANVIKNSAWEGMPSFQLYGRMVSLAQQNEIAKAFIDDINSTERVRPWLRPSVGFLDAAGTSLQHEIPVLGEVLCAKLYEDDIVALSGEGPRLQVKMHDITDGSEHVDEIHCWSPDEGLQHEVMCGAIFEGGNGIVIGMVDGSVWVYRKAGAGSSGNMPGMNSENASDVGSWDSEYVEVPSDTKNIFQRFKKILKRRRSKSAAFCSTERDEESSTSSVNSYTARKDGEWEGLQLTGHEEEVMVVAVSWSGNRIVSGSGDSSVRIWDEIGGRWRSKVLRGHEGAVYAVGLSWDGKHIVSGSEDNTICVWEEVEGRWERKMLRDHESYAIVAAVSSDGKRVVTGSYDNNVRVWDNAKGGWDCKVLRGHKHWVGAICVAWDGKRIVSGSGDKTVRVWEEVGGFWESKVLSGHKAWVRTVGMSWDGKHIVSGSYDKSVRVWDETGGRWKSEILRGHEKKVHATGPSKCVISGSDNKSVGTWEEEERRSASELLRNHEDEIVEMAVSWDGKRVVTASYDKNVRVWDNVKGFWKSEVLSGHERAVLVVGASWDGKRIVSGSGDKTVRVWDKVEERWKSEVLRGHEDAVNVVGVSWDGKRIISGSHDKSVRVWEESEGIWRCVQNLPNFLDFSLEGQALVESRNSSSRLGREGRYRCLLEGVSVDNLLATNNGLCATVRAPPFLVFAEEVTS